MDIQHLNGVLSEADLLVSEQQIQTALQQVASQMDKHFEGEYPLLLCVMNGGLMTVGHLTPKMKIAHEQDYVHASRYGNETTGAELKWKAQPTVDLKDRAVVLVDDILDVGTTLLELKKYCVEQGAKSVHTAVLVDKQHDRRVEGITADFVGMPIEDRFIFGFGMDYQGAWRNLPAIYAVKGL